MKEAGELACRTNARFVAYEICSDPTAYREELYRFWRDHVAALIAETRPDAEAAFLSHALLASLNGELVHHLIADGGMSSERICQAAMDLTRAVLTAPPGPEPGSLSTAAR